jgi:hypothetical protein
LPLQIEVDDQEYAAAEWAVAPKPQEEGPAVAALGDEALEIKGGDAMGEAHSPSAVGGRITTIPSNPPEIEVRIIQRGARGRRG